MVVAGGTPDGKGTPGAVPVVAAVVRRDARYLVARRPAGKRHGGLWEFPGGKVTAGETDRDALERELREELDVSLVAVGPPLYEARDPGTAFLIRFRPVRIRGEPRAREHSELRWASVAELRDLPLAPGDARFVREELGDPDVG